MGKIAYKMAMQLGSNLIHKAGVVRLWELEFILIGYLICDFGVSV